MTRQIKFRAWIDGRMFPSFDLYRYIVLKESEQERYTTGRPNSQILMQFTGLLDRHGKEIYEGDIIGDELRQFEIIWKDGIGDFQQEAGWWMRRYDEVFALHQGRTSKYEIIGNIYENPELLDNTK